MKRIQLLLLSAFVLGLSTTQAQDSEIVLSWEDTANSFRTAGDTLQEVAHLSKLAHQHWNHQESEEAIEYFSRLLPMYQSLNDTSAEAAVNRNLGLIYSDLRNYEKSVDQMKKSLELYQTLRDTVNEGTTLVDLATALNRTARYQEAMHYLKNSLPIIKRAGRHSTYPYLLRPVGSDVPASGKC